MANKLKKLPNLLNKSPWLWRSCTQSRTLSFRTSNDIFRTMNSAYEEEQDSEETPRADMSDDDDQIEALVRRLSLRPGKRLFSDLGETNSIMTPAEAAVAVTGNCQVPFKESVAMAMDSKEPYMDFKKSMEEMVEAHGLKDWKGMEMLLSWYLKANGKTNHEFIIGAFVDLLVGLAFGGNNSPSFSCCCCLCNNSPNSPSSSSSLLCSSSSFVSSSCSSCSSFRGPNCMISSNSVQIMDDIVESECSSSSSARVASPCLSSLFENEEEEEDNQGIEEDF